MKPPESLRSIYIRPCQINEGRVATPLDWNVHTAALWSLASASVNMHLGHTLQMFNCEYLMFPLLPTFPNKERRLGDTSTKLKDLERLETMQV
jgi:hypothetical protein